MSLGLIFLIVMQNFAAIQSAILKKMTFEAAIFVNFPDIPKLKIVTSAVAYRRQNEVHLAELPFLYFL